MKVPLSWLREFVPVACSPAELSDALTFSGIEVEGIATVGAAYDAGIVVGEVLEVRPHPGADRLRLCRVNDGREVLPVVCGAPNVAPGVRVPLARVGARLPNGTAVRPAKLRGETSLGMLCAEDELGLSADHSGLLLLPGTWAAGTPFQEVVGPPETVFDLEVTWNRPDCLCMVGIAREVAAVLDLPLTLPVAECPEVEPAADTLAAVEVRDPAGCPRYTARVLDGVRIGPSPAWLRRRLTLAGVRPIGNVVDITNYVMLECGQPLHAFDRRRLAGGRIVVRRAVAGEALATLDGVARAITPAMLVIADAERPVALAGIMGGAGSEIADDTTAVLLESACFAPPLIHATSVALGLATESSRRYERGVDVGGAEWASRRAAGLMAAHADARVARGVLDVYPAPRAPRSIRCRFDRVRALLGVDIPDARVVALLGRLGLPMPACDAAGCTVEAPTYRPDLEVEADLIEEVARLHGMANVPAALPTVRLVPDADDARPRAVLACRRNLAGLGLWETLNYSFVGAPLLDLFEPGDAPGRVRLPNPVSAEHALLRNALVPQMVETLGRNLARQVPEVACFELGRVFARAPDGAIVEAERVCIGLLGAVGRVGPAGAHGPGAEEMFLWLKGVLEGLLRAQRLREVAWSPAARPWLERGAALELAVGGRPLGVMGLLAAPVRQAWRMNDAVAVAELELDGLLGAPAVPGALQPLSAFPAVTRDVAVLVDAHVRHADLEAAIRASAPPELTGLRLFDIFQGRAVGEGRKSMAYSLTFRSHARSLTDEEANGFHEAIKRALRERLNVEIRDS